MLNHEYETIYILRPELPEEESTRIHERFQALIEDNEGSVLVRDDWGRQKMAYQIRKHHHGHYVYLHYVGPAQVPVAIERYVRIEDNCIRLMTVKLDDNVDVEATRAAAEERVAARAAAANADSAPSHR